MCEGGTGGKNRLLSGNIENARNKERRNKGE